MLGFIFWTTNIMTLILLHMGIKGAGNLDGNMLLGVSIPISYLQDDSIKNIMEEFEKRIKKFFWLCFFVSGFGYFLEPWVSLSLLWILIYIFGIIGIYNYCIEYYAKKIRKLKKERVCESVEGYVLNLDTEVSRLKNTFPVRRRWFLPPLILIILAVGMIVTKDNIFTLLPCLILSISNWW